jgi:hypothetical protein
MCSGEVTPGQRSEANTTAISFACVILITFLITLYLAVHWTTLKFGSDLFFYLDSFIGRAIELFFWSTLGVLYAALGRMANIMINYPPTPFSMRHILLLALKNTLMAWVAVTLLWFASGVVLFLNAGLDWLSASNKLELAAGLIPASFILGLYGHVANSFFLGLWYGIKRRISEARKLNVRDTLRRVWSWLKTALKKTMWLDDSIKNEESNFIVKDALHRVWGRLFQGGSE